MYLGCHRTPPTRVIGYTLRCKVYPQFTARWVGWEDKSLSPGRSFGADTILGHEAGRLGIAGGNAGGGHRFAGLFAPGDFQVERQQLSQEVFLGRETVSG